MLDNFKVHNSYGDRQNFATNPNASPKSFIIMTKNSGDYQNSLYFKILAIEKDPAQYALNSSGELLSQDIF